MYCKKNAYICNTEKQLKLTIMEQTYRITIFTTTNVIERDFYNGSKTGEANGSQDFKGWKEGDYDKDLRNPSSVQYTFILKFSLTLGT